LRCVAAVISTGASRLFAMRSRCHLDRSIAAFCGA
jgi:hypothetical protein